MMPRLACPMATGAERRPAEREQRTQKPAASACGVVGAAARLDRPSALRSRPMTYRPLLTALALALAASAALAQASQARTDLPGTAPAAPDDRLYRELGGRTAIQAFTDDFYDRMLQDARIARYFDGINVRHLKRVLADYFCVVAGGPCVYDGVSMKDAHAHLGIDRPAFNALVENLQDAMGAAGVPFAAQNRLLARMAFFHRDIVTQ